MGKPEPIVDRAARDAAAGLLRQCLQGQFDIDDALNRWPRSRGDGLLAGVMEALMGMGLAGLEEGMQEYQRTRCCVRLCIVWLLTDWTMPPRSRAEWDASVFQDKQAVLRAAAALTPEYSPQDLYPPEIDRNYRDRGAALLDDYLGGGLTGRALRAAWPVPKAHLDSGFLDDSLRQIHLVLLRLLPNGDLPAGASIRPVVERCRQFLHGSLPSPPRPRWDPWLPLIELVTFLPAVVLTMALLGVPLYFVEDFSLTMEQKWVGLPLSLIAIVAAIALLLWLSRVLLRRRRRHCLLTGRMACWPFARAEDMVAGQPGDGHT